MTSPERALKGPHDFSVDEDPLSRVNPSARQPQDPSRLRRDTLAVGLTWNWAPGMSISDDISRPVEEELGALVPTS